MKVLQSHLVCFSTISFMREYIKRGVQQLEKNYIYVHAIRKPRKTLTIVIRVSRSRTQWKYY